LEGSSQEAATLVMQVIQVQGTQECTSEAAMLHMQMVRGNYKGYTKQEIMQT
jgi:hypothetical protein